MDTQQNREYMKINQERWDELVPIHTRAESYRLNEFLEGENSLHSLELEEVGDVDGMNLLHLQCHFGMDTLSWARLGAHVTGMDYSEEAIKTANDLAQRCMLDARFLCCNLYDLPQYLLGQFDIVFTSYGVLNWLPDIPKWAQIAASYVKSGGLFYIADFHPFANVFDDDNQILQYRYPYFEKEAMKFEVNGTYADQNAKVKNNIEFGWNHRLGDIVTSLINAGLQIEFLHEFSYSVFQQLPMLVNDGKEEYIFPDGSQPIPLMFSLKARKK